MAYYDIFKNYFANKQEKNFYIINNEVANTINIKDSNGEIQTLRLNQTTDIMINRESTLTYNLHSGETNVDYSEYWENLVIRYYRSNATTTIDHTAAFLSGLEGDALNVQTITLKNLELAPGYQNGKIEKIFLRSTYQPNNVHLTAVPLENLSDLTRVCDNHRVLV